MKTRVLVTGANGQLGKTIKELYWKNKDSMDFVFVTKSQLDITCKNEVDTFFNKSEFDYCINCAAYTNVEQADSEPEKANRVNAEGVKNLAEACKLSDTILIHISTDYVFDGTKNEPYTESDDPNPINEYGKSKLLGETYIVNTLTDYFIIRTSWLYSKHEKNFLTTIVKKIKENSKLKIITTQKGTPTSCVELSRFIYFLIKSKEGKFGFYNFSALGEATWYDFAVQIAKHFKNYRSTLITPVNTFDSKVKRPEYSVLSNKKSQSIYSNLKDWRQSVDNTISD